MDEYGTYTATSVDWDDLTRSLIDEKSILFSYSKDGVTAYVINITRKFKKLGTLPFGGNPTGSCLVSVLFKGCFWFDLFGRSREGIHPRYVSEKLGLDHFDAETIAELLTEINKRSGGRYGL